MSINASTPILETPRLQVRRVASSDGSFFLRLLNDPSWLENIGDRGVHSDADAESYIKNSIWAHYHINGYGMYAVQLKSTSLPIGICGLVKRDFLSAPDLGFALLPDYVGQGFASEAARGLMLHAQNKLGIGRLYAIARRGNYRSVRLLDRLGFRYEGPYATPEGEQVELYATLSEGEGLT
ncbi:MAG: GNAT family N-acetyltransferase [Gammaproteobacteria bacterium]|nr:MAG: GNAT family N-acetyltransferase [Gammaproteobacteria bacterium]